MCAMPGESGASKAVMDAQDWPYRSGADFAGDGTQPKLNLIVGPLDRRPEPSRNSIALLADIVGFLASNDSPTRSAYLTSTKPPAFITTAARVAFRVPTTTVVCGSIPALNFWCLRTR